MLLLPQKSLNPTPQSYPRTIKVTEFLWDLPEIEGTHTVIGEKKKKITGVIKENGKVRTAKNLPLHKSRGKKLANTIKINLFKTMESNQRLAGNWGMFIKQTNKWRNSQLIIRRANFCHLNLP